MAIATTKLLAVIIALAIVIGGAAVVTLKPWEGKSGDPDDNPGDDPGDDSGEPDLPPVGGSFKYVSLGASNTNGYGLSGYITDEELELVLSGQAAKEDINDYGYQRVPEGGYPDLIRDHFVAIYGADNVEIDQLAISSMRVEELRVILDDSYDGDDYTSWRFTGGDEWFNVAEPGGLSALREKYAQSITSSDLITIDIGWNNFGVYICNQLVDYLGSGNYIWTVDIESIFDTDAEKEAAIEAKNIIRQYIVANVGEGPMADAVTDIFAYSILGFMHNFDIVMDEIYTLNPDANVIVIGIQNLLHGVVVELDENPVELGKLFGNYVDMANYYVSSCSPHNADYLYVKVGENGHSSTFLDLMKNYDGDVENLNPNVKDCYNYYDNNFSLQIMFDSIAAGLIEENIPPEYMGIVEMVVGDGTAIIEKGKEGALPNLLGNNFQEMFDNMYWPAVNAAYDTLSQVIKEVANMESVKADALLNDVDIGMYEELLMERVVSEIAENSVQAMDGHEYTVDMDKIMPDEESIVVTAIYVRYYLGNSFFIHPDENGHAQISNAVLGLIDNPATEKEQELDANLKISIQQIDQLLKDAAPGPQ